MTEEIEKRRQALVTVDNVGEKLEAGDYGGAAEACERLRERIGELREMDNGEAQAAVTADTSGKFFLPLPIKVSLTAQKAEEG